MLRSTFLHIPGIGPGGERRLWAAGLVDWALALDCVQAGGRAGDVALPPSLAARLRHHLPASLAALEAGRADSFLRLARFGEAWRLYGEFADACLYLDIETNGGQGDEEALTVVGVSDGRHYEAYVADDNLEALADRVDGAQVLVTFNGASFDVPVLRRLFRRCRLPKAHIDLRYAAAKAGLKGGLKRLEEELGLEREASIRGLDGWDAVRLWWEYQNGSRAALQRLIAYNRADVENLKPLMAQVYEILSRRHEAERGAPAALAVGAG